VPAGITLQVAEDGADPQRVDDVTGLLRRELLQLDVADVRRPAGGDAPEGSRAFDVAALGVLVVTLGHTVTGLREVVWAVRAWLGRGGDAGRTVRIEVAGDVLELSGVSATEQDRLVDLFVRRHAGDAP
jgi:hypothetical protein